MNKKRNNKGFSLVELIVVIAVMAVLVVVLAPAYLRYVDKAKVQKDVSAVSEVVQAIKLASSEEAVAEEIGATEGVTTVVIDGSTGAIAVPKKVATATGTDLLDEITSTVGSNLTISSSAVKAGSVTINVWKNDNYQLTFKVVTSGITNTDAKTALEALK